MKIDKDESRAISSVEYLIGFFVLAVIGVFGSIAASASAESSFGAEAGLKVGVVFLGVFLAGALACIYHAFDKA